MWYPPDVSIARSSFSSSETSVASHSPASSGEAVGSSMQPLPPITWYPPSTAFIVLPGPRSFENPAIVPYFAFPETGGPIPVNQITQPVAPYNPHQVSHLNGFNLFAAPGQPPVSSMSGGLQYGYSPENHQRQAQSSSWTLQSTPPADLSSHAPPVWGDNGSVYGGGPWFNQDRLLADVY
ncbi:unnamed protein product [Peniophora sp. CBMAI 1063]|nr:unnamed protein product [Peniophora sp. CBMAI 1063]